MKKIKILLISLISILLPSCSTLTPPFENNNLSNGEQRLSNISEDSSNISPSKRTQSSENLKFPIGGNLNSGENVIKTIPEADTQEDTSNSTNTQIQNINDQTDIDSQKQLLATYRTKVYTKTEDRQKNLRIVCEKLTGTILKSNQEFSYNTTCGPFNKENGFGKATVFLGDGTEAQDYGGGVCQLSSTLYNAVKDLNVEITERHNHSKKVYYVPDGQDATVSYGNLDFKFKNLNNYSLQIEAHSNSEFVEVNVYKA